jgi:hypothetical protein
MEEPGAGRVLVVDGGRLVRWVLLGDKIAELAVKMGGKASSSTGPFVMQSRKAASPI